MQYLFEISKEHKTLPAAEIKSSLSAENIDYNPLDSNEEIFIIETNSKEDKIKKVANRLSFTFHVNKFIFSCKPDTKEIKKQSLKNLPKKQGSIAIKYRNRSTEIKSQPIVKTLARVFTKNRNVSLEKPDIEIRGIITDSYLYVGLKIAEVNRRQFEKRKVQNRPFFSPISMHPKLARALVNLSNVKKDETLLDPFCGTGGLLIEAGLIGAKIIGSDIENKMIEGCKKNLDFYNIKDYKLFHSDIGEIKKYTVMVDAVVTDLPYGKSTTTKGEDIKQLYERTFENISYLLKKNCRAVIGLPYKDMIPIGERYLSLLETHECRVHRSLTRYFAVYKR